MMISDPPLIFEYSKIGDKVSYNSHKQESLDGFIKAGDECYTILPCVIRLNIDGKTETLNQNKKLQSQAFRKGGVTSIIGSIENSGLAIDV